MRDLSDFFLILGILLHYFKIFLNYLYVCHSVCWPISLLKGPSFGNFKDQRGLQDKSPSPAGYKYSPQANSPILSSAFALWAKAELPTGPHWG